MTEDAPAGTPTERLAATITEALLAGELIPAARAADLRGKLAAGGMKEADWRLFIELGINTSGEADRG